MRRIVIALCACVGLLCAGHGELTPSSWELYVLSHNGEILSTHRLAQKVSVRLQNDGRFGGSSGCNNFFGSYEYGEGVLMLSSVGATRKMCDTKSMDIESLLLTLFRDGKASYTLENDELILERDSLKAVFKKAR